VTADLKISIEGLYSVFSRYSLRSAMEGCPCCVADTDKEKIHIKQLRQLDGEDLGRYTFKAMTTWGNTADFKHYLPRILELLSTTDFNVDSFIVLGKLDYGKWTNWASEEQKAIRSFLLAWCTDLVKNKPYFDKDAFFEINRLLADINPLLESWVISFDDNSFRNLVDLLYQDYPDLVNKHNRFREVDKDSINKLLVWLKDKKEILEHGFFHYEHIDKAFAEKISNTLYLIERTA
jgi:hypothetical protein